MIGAMSDAHPSEGAATWSASKLAAAIRDKDLGSRELLELYLDRIDRLWPLAILVLPLVITAGALVGGPVPLLSWAALALADALALELLRRRRTLGGSTTRSSRWAT